MNIVEASNVRKVFDKTEAVRSVDFDVRQGECFGLLGPNGAGKSTLIRMIYGALMRSGGSLHVFGLDPSVDSRSVKKRLGVVLQENALDEEMTVRSNMLMFGRCVGVPPSEREARVDELLELMALSHRADAQIRELSGGMQRRLAFVRALLGRPDLLILDEPTTGLDPAVRLLLWEKVFELKLQGITVLLTTHYMDEAERLCDRLMILDQGKCQAEGSPRGLIQQHCPGVVVTFAGGRQPSEDEIAATGGSVTRDVMGLHLRLPSFKAAEELVDRIGSEHVIVRPTNLEDVFLEITGKELTADA
ncbi:MAG: ABC transporter ATP-binding protein [Opitutales bacterium]